MELRLDRKLPTSIYFATTSKLGNTTEELFDQKELTQVWKVRCFASSPALPRAAIDRLKNTKFNAEFLADVAKSGTDSEELP